MKSSFHLATTILAALFIWTSGCAGSGHSGVKSGTADAAKSAQASESESADGFKVQTNTWQEDFNLSERTLLTTGRNDYFILEPGFQLTFEKEADLFSSDEKLVIIVLDETRTVDGMETRVVEEREWIAGNLVEISRNFFAICEQTKDVFYFGEEVDMYRDGKLVSHEGAWLAGEKGAEAGLIMPAKPVVGMKYYQEIARGAAMDRAEVIKLNDELTTPAGAFTNCLLTKESTALNPLEREFKTYAPGVGLIQDQKLLLTAYGFVEKQ